MKLSNKVALVTGGARGIGYAIAKSFHDEGAITIIADIDKEGASRAAKEIGGNTVSIYLDIANVEQIKNVISDIVSKYKKIDILANNAGILNNSDIQETTEFEWDNVMSVNLKGTFFLSQQALNYMQMNKFGRIINISSLAGRNGGLEVGCAYAASKAGIIGMSKNLARKMAPYGITVNAIAPGPTESDIMKQFSEEAKSRLTGSIPVKRFGRPEEIAAVAAFLASDDSAFITGAVIDINGGIYM